MPQASVATSPTTASRPPTLPPFLCICKTGSCAAWVHVAGELDLAAASELDEVLRDAQHGARLVVLDLRELTYIDSSAVHVILHATDRARREEGRLMLVRGPAQVDLVFALTGASDKVSIFDLDPAEPAPALHLPPRVCCRLGATSTSPIGPWAELNDLPQSKRKGSPWTCSCSS
jgi:anti-sigma B factor antagonist